MHTHTYTHIHTRTHTKVNLQAAKSNYERELTTKEEQAEEARRKLILQLRELESQLEDERKQRSAAQSAQKKTESELNELESQLEGEAKGREDIQRLYKRAHVSRGGREENDRRTLSSLSHNSLLWDHLRR